MIFANRIASITCVVILKMQLNHPNGHIISRLLYDTSVGVPQTAQINEPIIIIYDYIEREPAGLNRVIEYYMGPGCVRVPSNSRAIGFHKCGYVTHSPSHK